MYFHFHLHGENHPISTFHAYNYLDNDTDNPRPRCTAFDCTNSFPSLIISLFHWPILTLLHSFLPLTLLSTFHISLSVHEHLPNWPSGSPQTVPSANFCEQEDEKKIEDQAT